MSLPVALTSGDPAGVGPEIACLAWKRLRGESPFLLIADPDHIRLAAERVGVPVRTLDSAAAARKVFPTALPVLPLPFPAPSVPGQPDAENAPAVLDSIGRAIALWRGGEAAAICTNPVCKRLLVEGAGFGFSGHTEYLASASGARKSVMMLCAGRFRVVPATIHIPLADVPAALKRDLIRTTIVVANAALGRDFGLDAPRIAVAGLNPHAGEDGILGSEESTLIKPVVEALAREGMRVTGPHPADSMFHASARESFDAAVCMYHDQALIPVKTVGFDTAVNTTLGLPFVRTSPAHGTAFDIAGKGKANESSLVEALRLARRQARYRARRSAAEHG